jgi:hypothetical protein
MVFFSFWAKIIHSSQRWTHLAFFAMAFFTMTFFNSGCMPTATRPTTTSGQASTDDTSSSSQSDVELAWLKNFSTFTIVSQFRDSTDVLFLRGKQIENFLTGMNEPLANYCLEFDFGPSVPVTEKRYLRLRANLSVVNDVVTRKRTNYLKVDMANAIGSQSTCANLDKVDYINDTTTTTRLWALQSSQTTTILSEVWSSSAVQIRSSTIKFYYRDASVTPALLKQIRPREVQMDALALALAPGNTPSQGGSCSNSSCVALGFDCCLNNQCVRDGAVRDDVVLTSPEFLTAEQERLGNPLAFLQYPQFYYICGSNPTTPPPGGGGGGSGETEAEQRFQQLVKDYKCIEELKEKSLATPFHLDPIDETKTYSECLRTPATDTMYFENVLLRLYDNCSCSSSATTLAGKLEQCPYYHYVVTQTDVNNNPKQIECSVISTVDEGPFQNLNISLSNKAVPHRFFRSTDGKEIIPGPTATGTQEGDSFSYLDLSKTLPQETTYNMNAILGAMNINLDQAQPAQMVKIEHDKVYLITARSGFATPCATCGKDSWYATFSAHPPVSQGIGLQATGYSTDRSSWSDNVGLGNYEDTIFGRACWVPPTMLPFTHKPSTGIPNPQTQRLGRLKSQAVMWVNGYQRDWYGFNKGALIGSFDGVSWFAIGKGRIARSTTNRLYLALNQPYGDITEAGGHIVSVQEYDGASTAATLDFHPDLLQNHPNQNEAGNCQAYHRCNVDSDCITRLGWEYTCADVTQLKTSWPTFTSAAAEEVADSSFLSYSIEQILTQKTLPAGSTKRCVYRGAGALCRTTTETQRASVTNLEAHRLLTCAPNFYCATFDQPVFNKEVSRYVYDLDQIPLANNHYFGKDANHLGRPLHYLHRPSANPLTAIADTQVRRALMDNAKLIDPTASDSMIGLCRPGKILPAAGANTTPYAQHNSRDTQARTDYINQISACPSEYLNNLKVSSCPVLDTAGNYVHLTTSYSTSSFAQLARVQNSCGLQNVDPTSSLTADGMRNGSPFKLIESLQLDRTTIVEPTLARDACARKAGQVCHTDLDCTPNELHAEQAPLFTNIARYWGNKANKEFFEQPFICGQTQVRPQISDDDFSTYDQTKNRCCRAVGNDITTYSADVSTTVSGGSPSFSFDPTISGMTAPTSPLRYERFNHVNGLGGGSFPVLSAHDVRNAAGAITIKSYNVGASSILTNRQWATLNEANSKSCCGGGWIRKFSDGSTDWSKTNRLNLDVTNFQCLNYLSPLANPLNATLALYFTTMAPPLTPRVIYDRDSVRYCADPGAANGNCSQLTIPFGSVTDLNTCLDAVSGYNGEDDTTFTSIGSGRVSTLAGAESWTGNPIDVDRRYSLFSFFSPLSADAVSDTIVDASNNVRKNINIFIPSYVGEFDPVSGIDQVILARDNGGAFSEHVCTGALGIVTADPASLGTCGAGECCFVYNRNARILRVDINRSNASVWNIATPTASGRYGVTLQYQPPGTGPMAAPPTDLQYAKRACEDTFYLNILGRLELAGIPQITYPKLVCNNNQEKVVPGIFRSMPGGFNDSILKNKTQFNSSTYSFLNGTVREVNKKALANGDIFSESEFKCCTPLTQLTRDPSTCCSGFSQEFVDPAAPPTTQKKYKCLLPSKANLSVYFNRFVSNEGTQTSFPSGGLQSTDFNERTGEPLLTSSVTSKINAIGALACASGTTRIGGAFGEFLPEPRSVASPGETIYGLVDSSSDVGTNTNAGETIEVGYRVFMQGFRWNHHIYCE